MSDVSDVPMGKNHIRPDQVNFTNDCGIFVSIVTMIL